MISGKSIYAHDTIETITHDVSCDISHMIFSLYDFQFGKSHLEDRLFVRQFIPMLEGILNEFDLP